MALGLSLNWNRNLWLDCFGFRSNTFYLYFFVLLNFGFGDLYWLSLFDLLSKFLIKTALIIFRSVVIFLDFLSLFCFSFLLRWCLRFNIKSWWRIFGDFEFDGLCLYFNLGLRLRLRLGLANWYRIMVIVMVLLFYWLFYIFRGKFLKLVFLWLIEEYFLLF